jgi:hypothetical protein
VKPVREQKDDRKVNKICDINSNHFVKFYNDDEQMCYRYIYVVKNKYSTPAIVSQLIMIRKLENQFSL